MNLIMLLLVAVKSKLTVTKPLAQVEEEIEDVLEEDIDLYNEWLRSIPPHTHAHVKNKFSNF